MSNEWSRSTRYFVVTLFILGVVWLLYSIRPLMGPLVISALLAFLLNPVVGLLVRATHLKRNLSVVIVYFLVLAILIAIPSIFTPILVRQVTRLSLDIQQIENQVEQLLAIPINVGGLRFLPSQLVTDFDQLTRDAIGFIPGGALNVLSGVTENLLWLIVVLVTTFYLLRDGPRLREWIISVAPPNYREDTRMMLSEIDHIWGGFLRGQIVLMLVVGILTGVIGALVGLPGAVVIGIVAGLLDIIPSLGPTIAGAISVLVALFVGSSTLAISNFWFAVLIVSAFILIEQLKNIWLRPQIMGYTLHLHPALIFIGVIGALALVGVLGALIVIPMMASVGIISHYLHCKLLGEDPWKPEGGPIRPRIISTEPERKKRVETPQPEAQQQD